MQQFVMNFCLPCTLFNSCLSCSFGPESLTSMALLFTIAFGFHSRKTKYPFHNYPFFYTAKESGSSSLPC